MCRPTALWWGTKKEPLKALSVIPLGLEPKTYCALVGGQKRAPKGSFRDSVGARTQDLLLRRQNRVTYFVDYQRFAHLQNLTVHINIC